MSDYVVRAEFDATVDDLVDVHMRQVRRVPAILRRHVRFAIVGGVIVAALAAIVVDGALDRAVNPDLTIAGVLGGLAGSLAGPLFERRWARRNRHTFLEHYRGELPMRLEIELRPTCIWVRQVHVEVAYDWTLCKAVVDTTDAVELWLRWGLIVVRNRGFATPSDRERFIAEARTRITAGR